MPVRLPPSFASGQAGHTIRTLVWASTAHPRRICAGTTAYAVREFVVGGLQAVSIVQTEVLRSATVALIVVLGARSIMVVGRAVWIVALPCLIHDRLPRGQDVTVNGAGRRVAEDKRCVNQGAAPQRGCGWPFINQTLHSTYTSCPSLMCSQQTTVSSFAGQHRVWGPESRVRTAKSRTGALAIWPLSLGYRN